MKTLLKTNPYWVWIAMLLLHFQVQATHIFTSSCGYSVALTVTPYEIVPETPDCPNFYNYNVRFSYELEILNGPIPQGYCGGGPGGNLWTAQVEVFCYGNANGSYSLLDNGGSGTVLTARSNTINTNGQTNQYSYPYVHCSQANPINFQCTSARVIIQGPGIDINTIITISPIIPLAPSVHSFDVKEMTDNKALAMWKQDNSNQLYDYFLLKHLNNEGVMINTYQIKTVDENNYKQDVSQLENGYNYFELWGVKDNQEKPLSTKHLNVEQQNLLSIFPNPISTGQMNILMPHLNHHPVTISLFSTTGQLLVSEELHSTDGKVQFKLPDQITKGMYTLLIQDDKINHLEKIYVQ